MGWIVGLDVGSKTIGVARLELQSGLSRPLQTLARQAGFSDQAFEACLTDQKLLDGINAVKEHGAREFGVSATPTIFIDGKQLEGPRNIEALREIIDPKLDS